MAKSLLMIHGIGSGNDVWTRMKPEFEAAGYACIAPTLHEDQRPGENPPDTIADISFQDYIDETAKICAKMENTHGEKPAVIGHSMGGLVAQALAEQGAVSKAIFLTPAQTKECAVLGAPVLWTFANILASNNRKKGQKIWKTGFKYGILNCVDKAKHEEIYKGARYDSGKVYGELQDGWEIDESKVNVPTLTISAAKDRACLAKAVRKVGDKYAGAATPGDFIEYPENGHWIVDEPGTDKVIGDCLVWLEHGKAGLETAGAA